jgi:predicted kinase
MEKEWTGDLILLRGLPGSGKSTLGDVILYTNQLTNQDVLSADNFFIDKNGEYVFDGAKIKEAHNNCQQKCAERMKHEFLKIVVANTFTEEWEMKPYFEMADRYDYKVFSIVVENRHGGINEHNVPEEVLTKMRERFEVNL